MLVAPLALALALAPAQNQLVKQPAARPAVAVQRGKGELIRPVPPAAPGSYSVGGAADETLLKAAKIEPADKAVLDFFRRRTPPAPASVRIADLVKTLGSKDPNLRDAAQAELTAIGQAAVPRLRQAMNNIDEAAAAARAKECLQNIEGAQAGRIVTNAARLLAARKPAGAAEALIGYLPYAEDDQTFAEVEHALGAVAMKDGKPDPAILKALRDPVALRRGAAATVLCQAGGVNYAAVKPLLKDRMPSVRLKAALGLVGAYEGEAIPALIALLGDLAPTMRVQAEDYLTNLAGEWAVRGPKGNDLMSRKLRRDVWEAWWKNTDGDTLLEEFRSRTTSEEDREKIAAAIARLESADGDARDAATRELLGMGRKAAAQLRRAANDNHPRAGPLAANVLDTIEKDTPNPMPSAAARLLALRRPAGTVETLVAYLPFAESEESTSALVDILAAVGVNGGKGSATLVKALADKAPARRAGAAMALCRGHATDHTEAIKKLLQDRDAVVQFRAAQGLATLGERDAVPTLIGLLKDLPLDQVWEVEEFLTRIAGERSPTEAVSNDASRAKAVEAWTRWWKDNGPKVELARLDLARRELGFSLIVEQWNPARGKGRVCEVDAAGKIRWEIVDLNYPFHAQLLRGGNVLVIEQQNRVTERTRENKVVWDKYYSSVFHAERLRDGNTFLGCRNQLLIVDRDGKNVFQHFYHVNSIAAAARFRDGSMAYVSYSGHYVRLDKDGKQVKTFNLDWGTRGFGINGAAVLPGDRVLVSVSNFNKVMEYGPDGKVSWETTVSQPSVPHRLANGHTLVASSSNTAITEIDRSGKIVREQKNFSFRPFRVSRR